jgi:excisionase family DNA binding protein
MAKDIMDVKEVASYLGFSPTKIYRMLTAGEIPNVKVGGQYRFPKAFIDDWLAGKLALPESTKSTKSTKATKSTKSDKETRARAEDEIVGHLVAFNVTGSVTERRQAKRAMVINLDKLDFQYLAKQAAAVGVLAETIAIVEEVNKGG